MCACVRVCEGERRGRRLATSCSVQPQPRMSLRPRPFSLAPPATLPLPARLGWRHLRTGPSKVRPPPSTPRPPPPRRAPAAHIGPGPAPRRVSGGEGSASVMPRMPHRIPRRRLRLHVARRGGHKHHVHNVRLQVHGRGGGVGGQLRGGRGPRGGECQGSDPSGRAGLAAWGEHARSVAATHRRAAGKGLKPLSRHQGGAVRGEGVHGQQGPQRGRFEVLQGCEGLFPSPPLREAPSCGARRWRTGGDSAAARTASPGATTATCGPSSTIADRSSRSHSATLSASSLSWLWGRGRSVTNIPAPARSVGGAPNVKSALGAQCWIVAPAEWRSRPRGGQQVGVSGGWTSRSASRARCGIGSGHGRAHARIGWRICAAEEENSVDALAKAGAGGGWGEALQVDTARPPGAQCPADAIHNG